jgi:integrase
VKSGLVTRNVADAMDCPKIKRQEMKTWTSEDARRCLEVARDDRFFTLFPAAITTGTREGKLFGLHWQDVAPVVGTATIQQILHKAEKDRDFGHPKTERNRRRVGLLTDLVAALRVHKAAQNEEKLILGPGYRDYGLVSCVPGGAPISASNLLKRHFLPLIETAKVPQIRFHDLRHSRASLLLADGVHPKVVSERLGHASIAITLDTYSHVLPDLQTEVVAGLQRRLFAGVATAR